MTNYYLSLVGGLGNQLYILAYADFLERRFGIKPTLISWKDSRGLPNNGGNNRAERSPFEQLVSYLGLPYIQGNDRELNRLRFLKRIKCCRILSEEPGKAGVYTEQLPQAIKLYLRPTVTLIEGYFQSHRYAALSFKAKIFSYLQAYQSSISQDIGATDVAVHIRRGDFLSAQHIYNIYRAEHYLSALDYLREQEEIKRVFIFSDDFAAIKDEVEAIAKIYSVVRVESLSVLEDFYALTQFRRYALGNSTFSWWAAMLSKYHESATVVVPFNPHKQQQPDDSFYPEHWVKI